MNEQREILEKRIIEKAMKDNDFRKQLIENPSRVLKNETGLIVPDSLTVKVLEETSEVFYLVLPARKDLVPDSELLDDELSGIAGGANGYGTNDIRCLINTYKPACGNTSQGCGPPMTIHQC